MPTALSTAWKAKLECMDLREVAGFIGWFASFLTIIVLAVTLWVVFFQCVIKPADATERVRWTGLWLLMAGSFLSFRYNVVRALSSQMKRLLEHAEIFIAISLVMVFSANTAFYLHTPTSVQLDDLGFALIAEQPLHSPWRSVSDIMTIALPIVVALQSVLMTRKNRCVVMISFFRLMTICYGLRSITVPLTSLPGPAPHCRLGSEGGYHPPENWIDIVSRVGPMHGKFNTCGDLLFSGHMCYTNIALLLYLRQLDLRFTKYKLLRWIVGVSYLLTVAYLCIAGRKHYTVDVVLGGMMSTLVFFHFEHSWIPRALAPHPMQLPVKYVEKSCDEMNRLPLLKEETSRTCCACLGVQEQPQTTACRSSSQKNPKETANAWYRQPEMYQFNTGSQPSSYRLAQSEFVC